MITIYGFEEHINKCAPCIAAKRLCESRNIDYKFISVAPTKNDDGPELDDSVMDTLEALTGTRKLSMPQIFRDGNRIGGFNELRQYIASKK